MYTQLGVVTKGTIIEVNVSELGLVTPGGKVVWGKYAQVRRGRGCGLDTVVTCSRHVARHCASNAALLRARTQCSPAVQAAYAVYVSVE